MYSPKEYYSFAKNIYREHGVRGVYSKASKYLYENMLRTLSPIYKPDNIQYVCELDWDVLIILDGCRPDLLESVSDDYSFLPKPPHNTVITPGSYSKGWMKENFINYKTCRDQLSNIIHISGNPYTDRVFNGDEFLVLDEVWKYAWDKKGYMPPKPITDRSIYHYRKENSDKMIVHYMQPHVPFIDDELSNYKIDAENFGDPENDNVNKTPWELYRESQIEYEELWEAYQNNLDVVLKSVNRLINNIDADSVLISSDHSNLIGEKRLYGHPKGIPLKELIEVPWVETEAKNRMNEEPDQYDVDTDDFCIDNQLEALGYR